MKIRTLLLAGSAMSLSVAAAPAADIQIAQLRSMSLSDVLEIDVSTGTSKFLHQAPAVGYVITADDIARLGARNLVEVLATVPGLNVYLYQGTVNSPQVDLRGVFTNRSAGMLFLRDGKPLRLLSNSTMPEIFRLPVHFIDRIEVVRGPVSAVYGADALAGVINIVTRKEPSEAGAGFGNGEHRAAWAGKSGTAGPLAWALTGSINRNAERIETNNSRLNARFDQLFRHDYRDLDLKLRSGAWSANFWALNYGKDETGNLANPRREVKIDTRHRHVDFGYEDGLTPTTQFKANLMRTRFTGRQVGELRPDGRLSDGHNGEERTIAELNLTETRFDGHRLRMTAGALRERLFVILALPPPPGGRPGATPPPNTTPRINRYLSVQDEYAIAPDWELTLGWRIDRFSDIGSVRNPRLGLVWNVSPQLTAKLLRGDAFRAPAYGRPGPANTRPERLRNTELAMDYRPTERWHVLWSLYRYHASDLDDVNPRGAALAARDGEGSELEVGWLATPALRFNAALSYTSVTDSANGARVAYTPRTAVKFAADWNPADRWSANLLWEAYGERIRPLGDRRPVLDDFQLVHMTLRYRLGADATMSVAADNLFDNRAEVPVLSPTETFRLPGRSLRLAWEARF